MYDERAEATEDTSKLDKEIVDALQRQQPTVGLTNLDDQLNTDGGNTIGIQTITGTTASGNTGTLKYGPFMNNFVSQTQTYYTTTVNVVTTEAVYITDEVGPFSGGQTVFENIFALNSGTYYILARSQRAGNISAFSDLGRSPDPGPFTYSTRIDWNPRPAGASNGTINTSTFSSQLNILTTSTGAGFIPIVSATSGFQPVYADADLTFTAAPNTLGLSGIGAGINFVNTGTRITSPQSVTGPFMFQNNVTNGVSYIGVQPNGTAATAGVSVYGQSDTLDSQTFRHGVTANTEVFFNSTRNGTTRTLLPMNFYAGGGIAMSITTATRGVAIFSGTSASSTNTGALIVPFGGLGVGGTIFQGGSTPLPTTPTLPQHKQAHYRLSMVAQVLAATWSLVAT
jgi:hypothetical protein